MIEKTTFQVPPMSWDSEAEKEDRVREVTWSFIRCGIKIMINVNMIAEVAKIATKRYMRRRHDGTDLLLSPELLLSSEFGIGG